MSYGFCYEDLLPGLLGFGNVHRALVRLLVAKTTELRSYGIEWRIAGVATRRIGWVAKRDGFDPDALPTDEATATRTKNVHDWLDAAEADVLFEATSLNPQTGQSAIDYLRAALERGAHAITANKYRVMQPKMVIDANANETHFYYRPIGLLHKMWLKSNEGKGGTETKPELEYQYGFLNYQKTKSADPDKPQPIYVRRTARVYHASDNISDETSEKREYSDGFGRLVQQRAQAEEIVFGALGDDVGLLIGGQALPGQASLKAAAQRDANRVVVSGWQIDDNKGRVVEKYEPFFDVGWHYQPEEDAK